MGWALLLGGVALCAYGSGVLEHPENGYNWLDLGISLLLGRFGASGAAEEAGPIIKNVGKNCLAVSNTPIGGTLNPAQIAYKMKFGDYNVVTKNQYFN